MSAPSRSQSSSTDERIKRKCREYMNTYTSANTPKRERDAIFELVQAWFHDTTALDYPRALELYQVVTSLISHFSGRTVEQVRSKSNVEIQHLQQWARPLTFPQSLSNLASSLTSQVSDVTRRGNLRLECDVCGWQTLFRNEAPSCGLNLRVHFRMALGGERKNFVITALDLGSNMTWIGTGKEIKGYIGRIIQAPSPTYNYGSQIPEPCGSKIRQWRRDNKEKADRSREGQEFPQSSAGPSARLR